MGKLKITDAQRKAFINAQVHIEVQFSKASPYEWPSLFSNLIEPYKKDLSSARKFYESLSDEQMRMRFEIRMWEGGAWNRYEMLMGCSLSTLGKSIDPKIWSKKELLNVEMLLEQGKNQLMSSEHNFSVDEIPGIYNQLITGEWENFILIDDIDRFRETESKYWKDHGIDPTDITSLKGASLYISLDRPREKDFLNRAYIVAQEIQGLLWYKEFLKEVIRDGITFYNDQHEDLEQENKPKRKFVDIKNLQRTNDGYEAIRVSFDNFAKLKDRIPKWPELMAHMAEQPPIGFNVTVSYKGGIVSELSIEGVEKPIDREAFRKRYERYFPKPDIKADIS